MERFTRLVFWYCAGFIVGAFLTGYITGNVRRSAIMIGIALMILGVALGVRKYKLNLLWLWGNIRLRLMLRRLPPEERKKVFEEILLMQELQKYSKALRRDKS